MKNENLSSNESIDPSNTAHTVADTSPSERERICRETLIRFSAAWAVGDVDALLSLMSDEPIYKGSTGPEPGTVFAGREQVRAALQRMAGGNAGSAPAEPAPPPEMYFFADRALVFWRLVLPGSASAVDGVDVMTFTDDGRIAVKDAYRKAFG